MGRLRSVGLTLVFCLFPACQNGLTDADSALVLPEMGAALLFAGPLPAFDGLVAAFEARDFDDKVGDSLVSHWELSWEHASARGRPEREDIYGAILSLAADLTASWPESAMQQLRELLAGVTRSARSHPLPQHLELRISEAEALLAQAEATLASGDRVGASLMALRASDVLREITPKAMALTLVENAEDALATGSAPQAGQLSPEDLGRVRRLTRWARSAIASEDYERAVQRAFYACGLLGILPQDGVSE